MNNRTQEREAVEALIDGSLGSASGAPTNTLLVAGAPCTGKTEFALESLMAGLHAFGDTGAVMTVSNRKTADCYADDVVRRLQASSQARPVTTLSAVAFRVIAAIRIRAGAPLPKLLNGAEQDALVRRVLAVHVRHAVSGDACETCAMLREYFALDDWSSMVAGPASFPGQRSASDSAAGVSGAGADARSAHGAPASLAAATSPLSTTESLFARGINDAFVVQLRDMLARMDELGASYGRETEILNRLGSWNPHTERLRVQWRLAFALRREYARMVDMEYPAQFRLDSSRLLVEGTDAVRNALPDELPRYVVVDDFQDLTLAGLAFLQALSQSGARLVLVSDPDEAVQTFRGSYPEYLYARMLEPPFSAHVVRLRPSHGGQPGSGVDGEVAGRGELNSTDAVEGAAADSAPGYHSLVASRVSLSILSPEDDAIAPARRAWKLPRYEGSLPIAAVPESAALIDDGSVHAALYRSANEELDDVVWRVKEARLSQGRQWNDLALIAHDNATVRAFGERLRRDGVPVRYSSVTRPLKDEPFVQGLFALIELALLRRRLLREKAGQIPAQPHSSAVAGALVEPLVEPAAQSTAGTAAEPIIESTAEPAAGRVMEPSAGSIADAAAVESAAAPGSASLAAEPVLPSNRNRAPSLNSLAAYVRTRVAALMDSPLIAIGSQTQGEGFPARLAPVESAMNALGSLQAVLARDGTSETNALSATQASQEGQGAATSALADLEQSWNHLRDSLRASRKSRDDEDNVVQVDDRAFSAVSQGDQSQDDDSMELGPEALYVMLACDGFDNLAADDVVDVIRSVGGREPNAEAFGHLWDLVAQVADGMAALSSTEPQYALALAWDSCKVAERWQREALNNTDDGRAANDRLDAAMRLFDYAAGSGASRDIEGFLEQVRSMRIEADSLAKVAPIDQAVTVTTPAGADGQHWPQVWIVAMQEGVWPNLAARNTMFGGEELAQIMLRGRLADDRQIALTGHDPQLAAVLCGEQKSFLAALTRGQEQVTLSAVANDDLSPSDFLYGYLPELFDRNAQADTTTRNYSEVGGSDAFAGLDADPRGLVASARLLLSKRALQQTQDASEVHDAAEALALLACNGIASADPDNWAYPQPRASPLDDDGSVNAVRAKADDTLQSESASRQRESSAQEPEEQVEQTEQPAAGPVVSLYPSAVDGLWACPVCWLLENRFAGPQRGSAATAFGTLIHAVAQNASENGFDMPDFLSELPEDERITALTERMMDIYRELRGDPQSIDDPASRYSAIRKDNDAEAVIANIARYFVTSSGTEYLGGNAEKITVGTLTDVACERSFASRFSLDDILEAYNALDEVDPVSRRDLYGIMGALVGGWPEAMRENMIIRLGGRIDREETRRLPDGSMVVRLIDYKTGAVPDIVQQFSDLQLVCYQLGLAFPVEGPGGAAALSVMPRIEQSDLFYVANGKLPAESYAPESLFQPPLFVDGHLNDATFAARYHYTSLEKLTDTVALDPDAVPEGVDESAWRQFVALRGTQAVWALTMIARVFYAAAASCSASLIAHPSRGHMKYCRMRAVCPACSGRSDTVFEIRKGRAA
ncbi:MULTISPECIES: PD-(D/E)XK nuclease family protein [Bifidobacterium]|uniref:Uncharacterized protein n=2 Tax=Bifidobacterium tibiigranuli TaxID=2172043 RepID=A0A5N6S0Q0_9BIFI|nr:PD-(D/E)XK nuclease family protein [Bifidobacterium tibiigranuli]KAE8127023.1 hypothetical protein DDF78_09475 [Bifidobacterium tibiigranuli]KAE8127779.1 hypothetical protein DDE84_07660 [Bifidobacterium tibiigranuli]MCI1211498.1 PD-(D/E)XK nuclease family protein [Bifidobacterium tibiigranuli]